MRLSSHIPFAALMAVCVLLVPIQGPRAEESIRIVAFGDSLTAGYQLPPEAAFPVQLQNALRERHPDVTVANAGVSGDTSRGGLSRLDWAIDAKVDAVILELGANDALRGIDPGLTEQSLDAILQKLGERNIQVLVAGMLAPPNFGEDYAASFNPIYARLAEKHDALLYPFFLEGVAADPALNQPDGLHPTTEGVAVIVKNILPHVEELIARVEGARVEGARVEGARAKGPRAKGQ